MHNSRQHYVKQHRPSHLRFQLGPSPALYAGTQQDASVRCQYEREVTRLTHKNDGLSRLMDDTQNFFTVASFAVMTGRPNQSPPCPLAAGAPSISRKGFPQNVKSVCEDL